MTEKQAERLKQKIKRIKSELAADKKRWGGFYNDSRGLRYLPPQYYVKLEDYTGGLRYFNWFHKNFPDDAGFPEFLFEWTIILFKRGKTKEAEKKAFETYCSNTYLFDKYFGRQIIPIDKYEGSNLEGPEFVDHFNYTSEQADLIDFSEWLDHLIKTEKFKTASQRYIDIYTKLKKENDPTARGYLIQQARKLEEEY